MDQLAEALQATLSLQKQTRDQAESYIQQAANTNPSHALSLLEIATTDKHGDDVKLAAAVAFKNHVNARWSEQEAEENNLVQIDEEQKSTIKSHLLNLLLSAKRQIGAQLKVALTKAAAADFPAKWQDLLPHLLEKLKQRESSVEALDVTASICRPYRDQLKSDKLYMEINYILENALDTLLSLLRQLVDEAKAKLESPEQASEEAEGQLRGIESIVDVFVSLTSIELPDKVEEKLEEWMSLLHKVLEIGEGQGRGEADGTKAAVCEALERFGKKNDSDFRKFASTFAFDAWRLLSAPGEGPAHEALVSTCMRFLVTLVESVHSHLFQDSATQSQLLDTVVLPNLLFRSADLHSLADAPLDFLLTELHGTDTDTRRRVSSDFVRALSDTFPDSLPPAIAQHIRSLLSHSASSDLARQQSKDIALQLATSISARDVTSAKGATRLTSALDVNSLLTTSVLPEIESFAASCKADSPASSDASSTPIALIASLRFLLVMRLQAPVEVVVNAFPSLCDLLASRVAVVHSLAAHLIERLLCLRSLGDRSRVFPPEKLGGILASRAVPGLVSLIANPAVDENYFVMKCLMRVVAVGGAGDDGSTISHVCECLARKLDEVRGMYSSPEFMHFLFETVASLATSCGVSSIPIIEDKMQRPFSTILSSDVADLMPYVFQIYSLMLELRPEPLPELYVSLLKPILFKDLWSRKANVPALSRLLNAFISRAPTHVSSPETLEQIFGVYQSLIRVKSSITDALLLLSSLLDSLPSSTWDKYITMSLGEALSQIQNSPNGSKVRVSFALTFARMVVRLGFDQVHSSLESLQHGLSPMLLETLWAPSITKATTRPLEAKLLAVAAADVISKPTVLEATPSAWCALAQSALEALEQPVGDQKGREVEDDDEPRRFSASFAELSKASRVNDRDACPSIADPREYITRRMAELSERKQGAVVELVQRMSSESQSALSKYCQQYSLSLR